MIDVYFSKEDNPFVWGSDLHKLLEIKTKLSTWFPRMLEYGFEENKDFIRRHKIVLSAKTLEKDIFDWAMTIEMAKEIAMMQKTPKGKQIRNYLIGLDKKVTDGEFLNQGQILALMDICGVMGYFSVQEYFEKAHYDKIFKKPDFNWWEERARLFGYTKTELQQALIEVGKKYINQRQAVFQIEKYDLIRMGVIDMFLAMGKSKAYAQNVGNIAKDMAKKMKPDFYNDLNTTIDFKTPEQSLIITDIKNYDAESVILNKFSNKKTQGPALNKNHNQLNLEISSGNTVLDDAMEKALSKKTKS